MTPGSEAFSLPRTAGFCAAGIWLGRFSNDLAAVSKERHIAEEFDA